MSVYYFTIFLVLIFSFLAVNRQAAINNMSVTLKKQKNIWVFATVTVLIFVSGLRYYVGTDYGGYYRAFELYAPELWDSVKNLDEPGLPIVSSIINIFTNDGAAVIFTCSAFTIGLILYTTYKNVETFMFSTLLFIFTGVWHGSFNGVRQYIAAAILFFGYRYIIDKKFWKYLLVVFVAFLFHGTAIVMIVPYFILNNKISFKNIAFLIIGTLIFLANYDTVFSFIGFLQDETLDLTQEYTTHQVNRLRVFVEVLPAVACIYLYSKSPKSEETTFYINILILNAVVSVAAMNSALLTRFNIYTGMFMPLAFGKLIIQENKKHELIIKSVIVLLYAFFWYYEVKTSSALNNFQWIWQR